MIPVLSSEEYLNRMLGLPRVCADEILAFYEHRIGAICTDPKVMLLPLDDHIAHRGDGVFETIKYTDGLMYQLDPHLERMRRSAAAMFLEPPCPWETIREVIIAVAAAGGEKAGQLRVLLGRGQGGFGVDPGECPEASLYVVAYRFHAKPESWFENGLKGFRTSIPAKQSHMARVKNTNYVPNALMIREGKERDADIPFCFDDRDFLAESAVANLCLVDESGALAVPEFTHSLPGTTLLRAMELIRDEVRVVTRNIREEEIFKAREVLLLGTGPDCVAISFYEGRPVADGKPGPVSARLRALIKQDIRKIGTPVPGLA